MRERLASIALSISLLSTPMLMADGEAPPEASSKTAVSTEFAAFTGKVCRERVRLRTQANLGSPVARELTRGDLVVITGEEDDFYIAQAPKDVKGYVYRTYVIDGVIEGSNVNVRLGPSTEDPVITQLNTGAPATGKVADENSKWLQIALPATAKFYVAKEYVENVGGPDVLAKTEAKKEQLATQFTEACTFSNSELAKAYSDIAFDQVKAKFQDIIDNYSEFETESEQARDLLILAQDSYLQKKIAFLEAKAKESADRLDIANRSETAIPTSTKQFVIIEEPSSASSPASSSYASQDDNLSNPQVAAKPASRVAARAESMVAWDGVEERLFARWSERSGSKSREDFYRDERLSAVRLTGIIESYDRPVKNRPGNFVLRNSQTKVPEAYLYSTSIDLRECVGKEVSMLVVQRPNNHFAFPAYFVLQTE